MIDMDKNPWTSSASPLGLTPSALISETYKSFSLNHIQIKEALPPSLENETVFLYVSHGIGIIKVNSVDFELKPGAFIWLHSAQTYTIEPQLGHELDITFCVYDNMLISYLLFLEHTPQQVRFFIDTSPVVYLDSGKQQYIQLLFTEFEEESMHDDPCSIMNRAAIYGQIATAFFQEQEKSAAKLNNIQHNLAWDMITYITLHSFQNITIRNVADYFSVKTAQVNQELRMVSGHNFNQFLNRARINSACTCLIFSDLSASYIGTFVGYQSEVAFFRAFKALRGMTPQAYRKYMTAESKYPRRQLIQSTSISILHYVAEHYLEDICIQTASKQLYLSQSSINEELKNSLGTNFKSLLNDFRIQYARALLQTTDMPAIDIAMASGFHSVYTFSRIFKEQTGVSPKEYRDEFKARNHG